MQRVSALLLCFLAACVTERGGVTAPPNEVVSMEVVAGQNDTSYIDSTIVLSVHVLTAGGSNAANQLVNWVVTQGAGTMFVAASVTNSAGITANRLTLGAGDNTVEARATDSDGNPLTFAVIHTYGAAPPRLVDWIMTWNDTTPTTLSAQGFLTAGVPYDVSAHLKFHLIDGATREPIPGATAAIGLVYYEGFDPQGPGECSATGALITCNAAALDGSHIVVIPADPGPGYAWIPFRTSAPPKYVNSTYFQANAATPPAISFAASFTVTCNAKHTCSFDASSSTIPNGIGTTGSYNWSFGDGFQGTRVTILHDYGTTKTVQVTLKIYDSKLKSVSVTKTVITGPPSIVFSSDRGANLDVYTMNADGTGQTRLTTDPSSDYQPSWSPDRSKIVFVSNRVGNTPNIFSMNANGTNQTQLTFTSTNYVPQWSPDGSKIVFISERDGSGETAREVYVMNSDGSAQTRLTSNTALEGFPAWSPDGARISFESTRDGPNALYVMNANGTGQSRLATSAGNDYQPAWSPDGKKIAFVSNRDGNLEIYVMNADGTSPSRLTTNTGADSKPGWSPDGTKITFTSDRGGSQDIYLMNASGGGLVQLTTNTAADSYSSYPLH